MDRYISNTPAKFLDALKRIHFRGMYVPAYQILMCIIIYRIRPPRQYHIDNYGINLPKVNIIMGLPHW